MKKMIAFCAVLAVAAAAMAALTTAGLRTAVVFPSQSINASAAAMAVTELSGYKGLGEVCLTCSSVAAANSNRTVTVTLEGTNTVAGGWSVVNTGTYKGAAAGVVRVPCRAESLPTYIRVSVTNTTAASVVSGVLLAY